MELLIDLVPYLGGVIGIIIVWLLAKWGIKVNKEATISGTVFAINKLLEIFGKVEIDSEKSGIKGPLKLNLATEIAKTELTNKELEVLKILGNKAEKRKATFGDSVKAGVQDIFLNSVSMLAKDQVGKLIKKM